jgi:hypothetical protein
MEDGLPLRPRSWADGVPAELPSDQSHDAGELPENVRLTPYCKMPVEYVVELRQAWAGDVVEVGRRQTI